MAARSTLSINDDPHSPRWHINSSTFSNHLLKFGVDLSKKPNCSGNYGGVYLRKYAVKILNNSSSALHEWNEALFFQKHHVPNIPRYYWFLRENIPNQKQQRSAICMERLDRSIYHHLYSNNPSCFGQVKHFKISEIQQVAKRALKALHDIHQLGHFHGDIKPENVSMIGDLYGFSSAGSVKDHKYKGTPGYFPPETLLGLATTEKTDLFALGLTLFEMYTASQLITPGKGNNKTLNYLHQIERTIAPIPDDIIPYETPHFECINGTISLLPTREQFTSSDFVKQIRKAAKLYGQTKEEVAPFISFLKGLLKINPEERYSVEEALEDPFLENHLSEETRKWEKRQNEIAQQELSARIVGRAHDSLGATKYPLKKEKNCIIL